MHRGQVSLAVLMAAFLALVAASASETNDGLTVGVPVVYESSDGAESLTFTVEEVIDPYQRGLTAYDQDRLASEGSRYVGVRLFVGNDASEPVSYFSPWSISLLDTDTVLHAQISVQRDEADDPGLPAGEIAAGGSISGLLLYELPGANDVEAIVFTPSPDRSIAIADRGSPPALAAEAEAEPPEAEAEPPEAEAEPPEVEAEPPEAEPEPPEVEAEPPEPSTAVEPDAPAAAGRDDTVENAGAQRESLVGDPMRYEALDGSSSIELTVLEIVDPYENGLEGYIADDLDARGDRLVALGLRLVNDGPADLPGFFTGDVRVLGGDSRLYLPDYVPRIGEAVEADPDLPIDALAAGMSVEGLLFYRVPVDLVIESAVWLPASDRLFVSSTGGAGTPQASEPLTSAIPGLSEVAGATHFAGSQFEFVVTWDGSLWSTADWIAADGLEQLVLEGDVATLRFEARPSAGYDVKACVTEQVADDVERADGFDASGDRSAPTADGEPNVGGGLYLLTHDADPPGVATQRYVECRSIGSDATLRIVASAPQRFWEIDVVRIADVLATVLPPATTQASRVASDSATPLVSPAPLPSPTPAPAGNPTA